MLTQQSQQIVKSILMQRKDVTHKSVWTDTHLAIQKVQNGYTVTISHDNQPGDPHFFKNYIDAANFYVNKAKHYAGM